MELCCLLPFQQNIVPPLLFWRLFFWNTVIDLLHYTASQTQTVILCNCINFYTELCVWKKVKLFIFRRRWESPPTSGHSWAYPSLELLQLLLGCLPVTHQVCEIFMLNHWLHWFPQVKVTGGKVRRYYRPQALVNIHLWVKCAYKWGDAVWSSCILNHFSIAP